MGTLPGSRGDRYLPQGYDLRIIGLELQRGKGFEDMGLDVEAIKARDVAAYPFSQGKSGSLL